MTWRGAVRFLNGVPGIVLAASVALVAINGYIGKREQLAVARAEWKRARDSLRNVLVEDQLAADARDRRWADSTARLNDRLTAAVSVAAAAGRQAETASATLHALVDSNATVKAALDALEAAHARQVLSLEDALAISRAETAVERDRVAERDVRLLKLRGDYVAAIARADEFERQAHPGALRRVLDSPGTHLIAAVIGYVAGS